ncbi:MAG: hypothetical protein AB7U20_22085 [Planctomycetaceae bacterium]
MAVPQQQPVFCEKPQELAGHWHFAAAVRLDRRPPREVRADFAQTQRPREGPRPAGVTPFRKRYSQRNICRSLF